MAKRSIVWTETAGRQRRDILQYWKIRNGSTTYPEKLIKLIARRLKVILKHTDSYKITTFSDIRTSAMGHYSIVYKVTNDHLIIIAFWDNRQDPDKLIEIIKP